MEMNLKKLNGDSSWLWSYQGQHWLIDPWLLDAQVDLAPWFSKQHHVDTLFPIEDLPKLSGIFISLPFTDHCHQQTLERLPNDVPIYASKTILTKIKKWNLKNPLQPLSEFPYPVVQLKPKSPLDLVHYGYQFEFDHHRLFYAPHGYQCKNSEKIQSNLLITTQTDYQLPFWLGGKINLGLHAALKLANQIGATLIFATHDEQKLEQGLVAKFSRKKYANDPRLIALPVGETYAVNPIS